jgi:hypothetical protein
MHEGPRSCPHSNYPDTRYPSCYSVNASFIVSCPPFINLRMRFLLRGGGGGVVTPRVTEILIKLLKLQLRYKASVNLVDEV